MMQGDRLLVAKVAKYLMLSKTLHTEEAFDRSIHADNVVEIQPNDENVDLTPERLCQAAAASSAVTLHSSAS